MSEALAGKIGEYRVYREDGGTIRVDVRAPKIPNEHGNGYTLEHGSTTRARALKLARSVLPGAVIVSTFRHDHMIGSQQWREYVVEVPAEAAEAAEAAEVTAAAPAPAAEVSPVVAALSALVTDQNADDVAESIGYGVTYWGRNLTEEERDALPPTADPAGHVCVFWDAEGDRPVALTREDIRRGIAMLADPTGPNAGTRVAGYVLRAFAERTDADGIDTAEIDAEAADAVAQLAAFGRTIYG